MIKILKDIILTVMVVLSPIKATILAILALIVVDLILGIIASKKRKEPITSAGLRRTITKLFVFELALVITFFIQQYLIGDYAPVLKIVTAFTGFTELTSILENLNEINGSPVLSSLISKLGSVNDIK